MPCEAKYYVTCTCTDWKLHQYITRHMNQDKTHVAPFGASIAAPCKQLNLPPGSNKSMKPRSHKVLQICHMHRLLIYWHLMPLRSCLIVPTFRLSCQRSHPRQISHPDTPALLACFLNPLPVTVGLNIPSIIPLNQLQSICPT